MRQKIKKKEGCVNPSVLSVRAFPHASYRRLAFAEPVDRCI
ncbi:MAG TPA: hypothetical protein VLZ03_07565 [Thermodesulfobacteriota bacterium]|nr:hypothetical protein [Thermodesulfobacteriota bacterium]